VRPEEVERRVELGDGAGVHDEHAVAVDDRAQAMRDDEELQDEGEEGGQTGRGRKSRARARGRTVFSLNSLLIVAWMRESVAKSTEAVASLQARRRDEEGGSGLALLMTRRKSRTGRTRGR